VIQAQDEIIFYDGHCALCHAAVRFVVTRDKEAAFRFAPLQGETFQRLVPQSARAGLPDSIVLRTSGGELLTRSAAVIYIFSRLSSGWRGVAKMLRLVPRGVRDWGYDLVARVRRRILPPPKDICPVLPENLRERLES
jgi:predicted DCC family thiol-disulfide oxidoreductase YuxK